MLSDSDPPFSSYRNIYLELSLSKKKTKHSPNKNYFINIKV